MKTLQEIPKHANAKKALRIATENDNKLKSMYAAMLDRVAIIKMDDRLYYPSADIFVNAPLAIIQISLGTELRTLERYLGLPISKLPLKK